MQGWGERLPSAFPGMKVANRGISGDTTRGVLIRLEQDVLTVKPAGIVLLIGTNDLEEQASPEIIAGNLGLILETIRASAPNVPIILCDVFPSSSEMQRPSQQIRQINQRYQQLASQFPQVTRIDTFTLFDDGNGDAREEEFPDLLHPNDSGYAKWADALRPVLQELALMP
jgi:lysophospholipase L1-like esterase